MDDFENFELDMDEEIKEEFLSIIAPLEEDYSCERENWGEDCTYPNCNCDVWRDVDDSYKELPEMFKDAKIEDGFYGEY